MNAQNDSISPVSGIDFNLIDERVVVRYDLNGPNENILYYIELEVRNTKGEIIKANTINGDVNKMVDCGNNKMVIWEVKKDYPDFDDTISVTLYASRFIRAGLAEKLLYSTLYPGLSSYRETNKKFYLAVGAASYGLLGLSALYEKKALDNYSKYKQTEVVSKRDFYFESANQKRDLSLSFFYSAVAIWSINYTFVIMDHYRDKSGYFSNRTSNFSFQINKAGNLLAGFTYTYQF